MVPNPWYEPDSVAYWVLGLGVVVARVFISYASADRAVADEVAGWLRAAGHVLFLDTDLSPGSLGRLVSTW